MEKLSRQETADYFRRLAEKYSVLDYFKSGGGHDRFYIGKIGMGKPLFLACSRVGWVCVYVDQPEKVYLVNKGFQFEKVLSDDERYEYRVRVDADSFDSFLKAVRDYLNLRPSKLNKELIISKNEIINELVFKVHNEESIAMDLISLFNDKEFEDSLYTEAFRYLERIINGYHVDAPRRICIVIALAFIALKEYDRDLHSHIEINARVYFENKKYPYTRIRDAIYSVLAPFRKRMQYKNPNSYVAVPVILSCAPYYRVYDLFKIAFDIYRRKLLFDEDIDDEQIYEKVKETLLIIRTLDRNEDADDPDKIKGTNYLMSKYTQSCIYTGVEFDALIRIFTTCIRLIISHITLPEAEYTVGSYYQEGYERWIEEFDRDEKSEYEKSRSISRPYFILYNNEIYLKTGLVEFDESLDPNDVHILLYCDGEMIDDIHVCDPDAVSYIDPNELFKGFVVDPCTIPLTCNPLNNLHYTVVVSGQEVYNSKNKLFRQVAFFDGNGKEIKPGKEYDGEIFVLSKQKNDDEYGDKIRTCRVGDGFYISTIEVNSTDVFRFDGEPYVFYKIDGSKFLGYCSPNMEFESMEKRKYPIYASAVILFPASCDIEDIALIVDGKRCFYEERNEIWFSIRVFSNRSDGNLVYSIKIFNLEPGYHKINVININTGKEVKGTSYDFIIDPNYRSQFKRSTSNSVEYELQSAFIDDQLIEYKYGTPFMEFQSFVKNLGHGKMILYPPFISYSLNDQEWYGIGKRFCLCDIDDSVDELLFCGPRDLKAYYTDPKSSSIIKETNLKKDNELSAKYSLSLDYLRANKNCKKIYFVYGNYIKYLLINPTPFIIEEKCKFFHDKEKSEHHFSIFYDSIGEVQANVSDLNTGKILYSAIIRSGADIVIPDNNIPLSVNYVSVSLHSKKTDGLFSTFESVPFYSFPKYEIKRYFFSVPSGYPKIKFSEDTRLLVMKFNIQDSDNALLVVKPTGKYLTKILYSKVISKDETVRFNTKMAPFESYDFMLYPSRLSIDDIRQIKPVYLKTINIESLVLRKTFYIQKFITDKNELISAGYHISFVRMELINDMYYISCRAFNKTKHFSNDNIVVRLLKVNDKSIIGSIEMKKVGKSGSISLEPINLESGIIIKKIIIKRAGGILEDE